jgi:hypothetical protein
LTLFAFFSLFKEQCFFFFRAMNKREASEADWSALRQLFSMYEGRVLSGREAGEAVGSNKTRFYEWRRGRVPSAEEFAKIRAFLNFDSKQMATADDRTVFERFLTVTRRYSPSSAAWTIHVSKSVIRRWRSEESTNANFLPSRDKRAAIRAFLSNPLVVDQVVAAVRSGSTDRVKQVMQTGVMYDIDAPDAQGEVAIVRAAADGHDVIVGYLTRCGADPDVRDSSGATPLYKAAENGRTDVVHRLLNPVYGERATLDLAHGTDGRVALHAACENNHVECVRLLHEAGANHDVRSTGRGAATPLEIALRRGDDDECALILLGRAKRDSIIVLSGDESIAAVSDGTEASSPTATAKRRRTKSPPKREQDDDNDDVEEEAEEDEKEDEEEEDDEEEKEEKEEPEMAAAALRQQRQHQQRQLQQYERQQEQVQIRYDTLENFRPLGAGGFGTVHLVHWTSGPYDVAVKSLSLVRSGNRDRLRAMFRHEAELHSRLRHDRILSLYGVVFHNDDVHIVMPLMVRSLYDAIDVDGAKRERPPFAWPTRARICSEIASGLHYLHTLATEVLHRDLKSPNVLLDQYNSAKLADFGLAKVRAAPGVVAPPFFSIDSQPRTAVGSLCWQAPELHMPVPEYSTASDIFALGMVAWELASWTVVPFVLEHGWAPAAIIRAVTSGERPPMPASAPAEFAEAVRRCWAQRASERPSARDAFEMFRY